MGQQGAQGSPIGARRGQATVNGSHHLPHSVNRSGRWQGAPTPAARLRYSQSLRNAEHVVCQRKHGIGSWCAVQWAKRAQHRQRGCHAAADGLCRLLTSRGPRRRQVPPLRSALWRRCRGE